MSENQENSAFAAGFGLGVGIASLIWVLILSIIQPAQAQEIEGPPQYQYDLWTGGGYDTRDFDSYSRDERSRSFREDGDVRRMTTEEAIRRLPSMCIITPIPIDDRYVGCLTHFQPIPERAGFERYTDREAALSATRRQQ